jgi:hypothetical protein
VQNNLEGDFEDAERENLDDAFRDIDELIEDGDNGLSIENLSFVERYLNNKLELGLIIIERAAPVPLQFRAVCKREFPLGFQGPGGRHPTGVFWASPNGHQCFSVRPENRNERSVFVFNVESVHLMEKLEAIRSTVRLEPFDEFDGSAAGPLEFRGNAAVKVRSAPSYRECSLVGGGPFTIDDKVIREQVERGSQIVDAISDNSTPFDGDGFRYADAIDFVSGIKFGLWDDKIRLSFPEGLDGRFEVRKMFFGPFNLYSTTE